ncbi:DNA endonuclease SmrA [Shewanella avicenniae]|uniref:DNA endonuclease SmrA n=1 Tax=Shewanella avicenniae TaxID=2814294 RepID=A0ABX7QUH8_9GAMM|nr:DNA endonuclease SmrA [Shewanella avicenniae]QSX35147.1 DNA endonuclease SmrA [Shewanella avicenniae]
MHQDDRELFLEEMADVVPIKQDVEQQTALRNGPTEGQLAKKAAAELSEYHQRLTLDLSQIPPLKPDDMLSFKRDGVQEAVFKNFRQGQYQIAAELDIHAMSLRQARDSLLSFLLAQVERGHRCVLVIHGKGHSSKPFPGLMKSCVNYWLAQVDEVMAYHSAQRHHGGYGAVYVMLPKSSAKRVESRELNSRGVRKR